jgi:hypothetical protein
MIASALLSNRNVTMFFNTAYNQMEIEFPNHGLLANIRLPLATTCYLIKEDKTKTGIVNPLPQENIKYSLHKVEFVFADKQNKTHAQLLVWTTNMDRYLVTTSKRHSITFLDFLHTTIKEPNIRHWFQIMDEEAYEYLSIL